MLLVVTHMLLALAPQSAIWTLVAEWSIVSMYTIDLVLWVWAFLYRPHAEVAFARSQAGRVLYPILAWDVPAAKRGAAWRLVLLVTTTAVCCCCRI